MSKYARRRSTTLTLLFLLLWSSGSFSQTTRLTLEERKVVGLREAGVEGLFRAYESVDFLAPVHTGDTLQVTATIIKVGHTSRRMKFVAIKTKPKKLICRAVGTVVIPEFK